MPPAKKKTAKKKAAPKKQSPQPQKNSNAPLILIILLLSTALLFMVNKTMKKNTSRSSFSFKSFLQWPDKKKKIKTVKKITKIKADKKDYITNDKDVDRKKNDKKTSTTIKLYFIRMNEKTEKMYLSVVRRRIKGSDFIKKSLLLLAKGPSAEEKKRGYLNAVPSTLRIRSIAIINKTAVIDFNNAIEKQAAGTILIKRLNQIIYTATQFRDINSISIKINGHYRSTLGSDGLSISGPLQRK